MDKKQLSERDICTKFITPALRQAGWDELTQLREEVSFTKGRIIVRGRIVKRGRAKRADYILYFKPNIPLAVIEAKDNHCSVGDGLQQALEYAETLQLPFVFSHINKPELELFSTMFGGLAYGWLNWRTGSIAWSVLAHVYIVTLAIVLSAPR